MSAHTKPTTANTTNVTTVTPLPTLREARLAHTLGVGELARASGVSENTIYQIEHHASHPRLSTIRKLAAALDCDPRAIAWPGEPFA